MKKARYNKRMRTHKKLILVAAAVLVVVGVGTGVALAMQDEPKKVVTEQSAAVVPQEQPVEAVTEQQVAQEPQQTTSTVTAPTVDELKELAKQTVLDDGQNDTNANCFVNILDKRYGWANVTTQFIADKFTELDGIYIGMCPAYTTLQNRASNYSGSWDRQTLGADFVYPPGFRD